MSLPISTIGAILVDQKQHMRFKSGELWREWAAEYPTIFDEDDVRLAESQAQLGFHFFEWLAAILLYHSTGFLSLVEQYQFKNHLVKQRILRELLKPEVITYITGSQSSSRPQCPDLLCYAPDYSDWFFYEVKGPEDLLRVEQEVFYDTLAKASGKPIRLIQFREEHAAGA